MPHARYRHLAAIQTGRTAQRNARLCGAPSGRLWRGGGGVTPAAPTQDPQPATEPDPEPDPEPAAELPFILDRRIATVDDVHGVAFGPAIESAAKAAKAAAQAPVFGMAAQSRSSSGYKARAEFNAGVLTVKAFDDQSRETLRFDTADGAPNPEDIKVDLDIGGYSRWRHRGIEAQRFFYDIVRNPDYFDRTRRDYPVFVRAGADAPNVADTGATAGRVIVDTDDEGDWMALGYWWQLRGRDFMQAAGRLPTLEAVEIGAFADGPEFERSPANLPVTGSATYRGSAHGVYMAEYGTDSSDQTHIGHLREPGRRDMFAGEFEAGMSLTMDYAMGTVRGGIGYPETGSNYGNIYASGVFTNPSETTRVEYSLVPLSINFTSEFDPNNGRFASNDVRVIGESTSRVVKQEGQWSGQVSSLLTAAGEPRSAIGTFGVDATTAGDTRHVFVGTFGVYYADR